MSYEISAVKKEGREETDRAPRLTEFQFALLRTCN